MSAAPAPPPVASVEPPAAGAVRLPCLFGILTKLLATPTPRAALVAGKAFAAGVRAVSQVVVVLVLAAVLGVRFHWQPPRLLEAAAAVLLGATVAGIAAASRLLGRLAR